MAEQNSKKDTVSRQIYIPKNLNYEIEKIKADINHHEGKSFDLRDTCVELIRIGAEVKRKELDKEYK